jgi:diguanylate cyclase (GGDEF)-like protein
LANRQWERSGVVDGDAPGIRRLPEPARRRGLGRGLGAIIPSSLHDAGRGRVEGTDPQTGLVDRAGLDRALAEAVADRRRDGSVLAVCFVGLDRFGMVNELFGHRNGDRILRDVATRLAGARRRSDTVARFGGDEFVIVLPRVGSIGAAGRIAERVLEEIGRPFSVDGTEYRLDASIGVVVTDPTVTDPATSGTATSGTATSGTAESDADGDADAVDALLADADVAQRHAKVAGGGTWALFDDDLRERRAARSAVRHELRVAMARGDLDLEYEPVVSLDTGEVVGAEASCRWRASAHDPDRSPGSGPGVGLGTPAAISRAAHDVGLSGSLACWAVGHAMEDMARWERRLALPGAFRVWVTVTAGDLRDDSFACGVDELAAKYEVPASRLGVDIGADVVEDGATTERALGDLHAMGVGIRFRGPVPARAGPGWLRRLHIGGVVLDSALGEPGADLAGELVALVRAAGVTAFATGVASRSQALALRDRGCYAQGPYFGRPVPGATFW